ncbi:hypothetical protein [Campylobacter sp. MIT 97-5078]|uniref:hypothetical protein n=1 Tax=Campylobacter sp. MIT 97-5078 TaxID=1548153 RepID=UPI0005139B09|nr:hypothetical protein [Campylobacter sp. MIT 97-5078]KGI56961.1 hypothetical protein LR59_03760 [Campylobacter sp. MIT 97-5078]TQR28206.1 hypothetical protein DMB91_00680 [Campylobacter sp. MIT 97-5078]
MSEVIEKDFFELELEEKKQILQSCQQEKNMRSCFDCQELFECQIRKNYVLAVYNSMSKGKNEGGFDF